MAFKRREEPTTIEDERAALRAQHHALEDLKRELAERVAAVRERELELRQALVQPVSAPVLPPPPAPDADTDENALEAERRELALAEWERALAVRDAQLDELERELRGAAQAAPPAPDTVRLAQIETRLEELREAEKLFLRTRDELAARSEALSARERLAADRERELDELEHRSNHWSAPELSEMEARLRRLEQSTPREQEAGFTGGIRKLGQGTRAPRGG